MALVFKDRVRETTTTTGTGNISLGGAVSGFIAFQFIGAVNSTTYYAIVHRSANEWEVGLGTLLSATSFGRTTVLASSNSGSAVNFSAGTKDIFTTYPAGKAVDTTKAEEIAIQFAIALG